MRTSVWPRLSDGPDEKIQAVLDTGVCARVVALMGHSSTSVQKPALRTAGNIVTGDEHQTQCLLDCEILDSRRRPSEQNTV